MVPHRMPQSSLAEVGFYGLPGHPDSPADLLTGASSIDPGHSILDPSTLDQLEPALGAYRAIRSADRFAGRSTNPGR